MQELSLAQARRVALAAQGFCDPHPVKPDLRTLSRTLSRTGVFQVDSVNVLQRAHYMPLFSRVGAYDTALLHRAAERAPRRMVEYWAHVQAFMPVDLWPVMSHRMADYRAERGKWHRLDANPKLEAELLAELRDRGPSTARDLDDGLPRLKKHWGWNWSETRKMLDYLYLVGETAVAGRNSQFEVLYDLPERVLPPDVLALPTPTLSDASRELVRRAARSHGVATAGCLRDYYRMSAAATNQAITELVEAGELIPVRVAGWDRPTYLHHAARLPRKVEAAALLSPFDPLVWERARAESLFEFRYRIEIYVPAPQRVYGYYVLPFLLGDRMVARVDLKADRKSGALLVHGAFAEAGAPENTAAAMAERLRALAQWLGLTQIRVGSRGDLCPALDLLVS